MPISEVNLFVVCNCQAWQNLRSIFWVGMVNWRYFLDEEKSINRLVCFQKVEIRTKQCHQLTDYVSIWTQLKLFIDNILSSNKVVWSSFVSNTVLNSSNKRLIFISAHPSLQYIITWFLIHTYSISSIFHSKNHYNIWMVSVYMMMLQSQCMCRSIRVWFYVKN